MVGSLYSNNFRSICMIDRKNTKFLLKITMKAYCLFVLFYCKIFSFLLFFSQIDLTIFFFCGLEHLEVLIFLQRHFGVWIMVSQSKNSKSLCLAERNISLTISNIYHLSSLILLVCHCIQT